MKTLLITFLLLLSSATYAEHGHWHGGGGHYGYGHHGYHGGYYYGGYPIGYYNGYGYYGDGVGFSITVGPGYEYDTYAPYYVYDRYGNPVLVDY